MKRNTLIAAIALIAIQLLPMGSSRASQVVHVANSPYFPAQCSGTNYAGHWNHPLAIPVYMNGTLSYGAHLIRTPDGSSWSSSQVIAQIRIAINEFNTSTGSTIRLYYAGITSQTSVTGAIVVFSSPTPADVLGFGGYNHSCVFAFKGEARSGFVILNRFTLTGNHRYYSPFQDASAADLVKVLIHEIGHALGLRHPQDYIHFDSGGLPYPPSDHTPMALGAAVNGRHYTRYERDALRNIYGTRIGSFLPIQSGGGRGYGLSWSIFSPTTFGSMLGGGGVGKASEGAAKEVFAWPGFASQFPALNGISRTAPNYYSGMFSDAGNFPPVTAPSVAYGAGQYRMFWIESAQPITLLNGNTANFGVSLAGRHFSDRRIHWKSSSDSINWTYQGVLTDPSTGSVILTSTDDVSAGYDPSRGVFIVLWLDVSHYGRMMTMPGPGSSQSSNVYSQLPGRFWEVPSISCSSATCQLVGTYHVTTHSGPAGTPYLVTYNGIIGTNGQFQVTGTQYETSLRTTQAPSTSYSPQDNTFILCYIGVEGGSLYCTKKTNIPGPWPVPGGPIVIYTSKALSAPSLGNWTRHIGVGVMIYEP